MEKNIISIYSTNIYTNLTTTIKIQQNNQTVYYAIYTIKLR